MTTKNSQATRPFAAVAVDYLPGIAMSAIVAVIGYVAASSYVARVVPIPNLSLIHI